MLKDIFQNVLNYAQNELIPFVLSMYLVSNLDIKLTRDSCFILLVRY